MAKPSITWTPDIVRNANDSKAAGFIMMSPREFLALTTPGEHWLTEERGNALPLDEYNRFAREREIRVGPFLKVDQASGKVIGHEGRHRALALMNAGGDEMLVAVVLAEGGYARRSFGPDDIPRVMTGQFLPRAIARRGGEFSYKDVLEASKEAHPNLKGATVPKISDMPVLKFGFGPGDFMEWEDFDDAKEKRLGHLKNCAVSATVAHKLPNQVDPDHDTTDVCLTETQAAKLFGEDPKQAKRLGCGAFACGWKLPGGKVAKITTDPDDVAGFQAATEAEIPHVAKMLKAYRLVDAGRIEGQGPERPVWGMIMKDAGVSFRSIEQGEYDGPHADVLQAYPMTLDNFPIHSLVDTLATHKFNNEELGHVFPRLDPDDYMNADDCAEIFEDYSDNDQLNKKMARTCNRFVDSFVDTMTDLAQEGIIWTDVHAGNFAVKPTKPEKWSIVDLGFLPGDHEPDVPELKGLGAERKIKGTFCEREIAPKDSFDQRSFRYKQSGKSWVLIGCPKGKWDERRQTCKVGTRAHKVLASKSRGGACKRGRKITK